MEVFLRTSTDARLECSAGPFLLQSRLTQVGYTFSRIPYDHPRV